jgi:hypothetical protein
MPLHEIFTSSTCGPCQSGNTNVQSIFDNNPSKWTCIKYQMSWPGSGDPYYTAEGGVRRQYYGVTAVPDQKVDGGHAFDGNSNSYSESDLNAAYAVPAFVDISANMTITPGNQKVELSINISNNIDLPANTKLFVGIIEQKTTQNVGGNGETEFHYVMKKMLPDAQGKVIGPLNADAGHTENMSYTFNGSYRLPPNANAPIDHTTEHSVEEFNDLNAVIWLQNPSTMKVYQSAFAITPVGMDENTEAPQMLVYPNPASDLLNVDMGITDSQETKLTIVNSMGQTVYHKEGNMQGTIQMDLSSYAEGIYFIRMKNDKGSTAQSFIISH